MALRSIELFAGGGGLALGLERCDVRTVCFVEREAYAAAVLAARMGEGRLAPAPIWSDVCTFDGRPWRGVVDLVAGGFPCTDVSSSGPKAGLAGERSGLWREFARIIGEVGPRFVFVENVPDLAVRGLLDVLGELAALGFDAEWLSLPAPFAGAPQRRERLFLLADANGGRLPTRAERNRTREDDLGRAHRDGLALAQRRAGNAPSRIRRMDDAVAYGVDRLRLLGNGVVPDQAALAFHLLWDRLHGGRMTPSNTDGDPTR